jgi:vacuolar-type H+-ATPase subunit F/Vma7
MTAATFIGDEMTAAGFRLAGLRVHSPDPEKLSTVFRSALVEANLVILTGDVAAQLPAGELKQAITRAQPPVAIVSAAISAAGESELVHEVRTALGMEA